MDFEKVGKELQKSGKADKVVKSLANSEEAKRLSSMLDTKAVENAAKSGDAAALKGILKQVLDTDEGKRLAQMLGEAMK